MADYEALIVGAGPTGLSMAIELKRMGIPFRLVEKSEKPAQYSQALVVQARTLEQFERYGIAGTAVQRGRPLKHASIISEGKQIVSFTLDKIPGHYPFVLFLPQNETEALLIEHLESLGGKVERGIELKSIAEKDDEVTVELRSADGKVQTATAEWLAGCDGAHSAVRDGLKIPFSGETVELNFFLGDFELEGPQLPGDELCIFLHRGDVVFIGRLKEKLFRVIVALHSEQDAPERKEKLTIADFQKYLDNSGIQLRVVSSQWMTPFRVSGRRAEHTRHGRVFLAEDASHIHSPVAGQGMNTGIQDTANLAWKLAAVRNGADAQLLDSYEEERGMVSEALLKVTSRGLKAATTSNRLVEEIRDIFLRVATRIPLVQEQMVGFVSETAISYRDSTIVADAGGGGSLRAGDRMPNPEIAWRGREMRLLDPLKSGKHLIVGFDVKDTSRIQEQLPQAEFLFVNSADLARGKEELEHLLGARGEMVAIRPDGYIGFRGRTDQVEELVRYGQMVGLGRPRTAGERAQSAQV
jgi:2-polyprenyl-6-methoxyphenol hydroxylase-like FAD-dependent oxidoreductase